MCWRDREGLLLLLGVHTDDTVREAEYLVDKCINLRIFSDADDR
jgi:D-tyrosyl-tRNA(Tyr) deacylase